MANVDADLPGTLGKAFLLLDAFGVSKQSLTLSDLTRRSGLPKTTAFRVLQQLLSVGALEREGSRYRVGTRMFALGTQSSEAALRDAALPAMVAFNRRYGHTVHLAVLSGHEVLYLEKLHDRASSETPAVVGTRLVAHCTAVGKVLLAAARATSWQVPEGAALTPRSISSDIELRETLTKVREFGYAMDDEEAAPGLRCLAVPVKASGDVVAALSIAFASSVRLPRHALPALQETATRIGRTSLQSHGASHGLPALTAG
jgi:DNA-binding IclR family transcriptional regulator